MSAFRLILVLLIIGGLILLTLQNLALTLPLNFLGIQTQALPLGVWVLFSLGAGFLTSLLLAALLRFSLYLNAQSWQTQTRANFNRSSASREAPRTPPSPEVTKTRLQVETPQPSPPTPQSVFRPKDEPVTTTPSPSPVADDWTNDWNTPSPKVSDWEETPTPSPTTNPTRIQSEPPKAPTPETTYSYNAQDRDKSGVGRTEDVYDANYRVIIPPSRSEPPASSQPNDDWENLEDEDWGLD